MNQSIVFFGSSPFSVFVLQKLIVSQIPIAAVITFPDKPVGRHLQLSPNPVKSLAQKSSIPIIYNPIDIMQSVDLHKSIGLVAAYGKIIRPEILNILNNQIFNIHPSLLPKYRGPSPLQQQILDGVSETGVTLIQLDKQMDHGPIVAQEKDLLSPSDTTQSLGQRLFEKGADIFINLLNNGQIAKDKWPMTPQDDSLATYTHKLTRESGFIEFEKLKNYLDLGACDLSISRMFMAFSPWPGVWTTTPNDQRLKLISLNPILVQLEGKTPQPWPFL